MKILLTVIGLTVASMIPSQAVESPNLNGYICIDNHGIHHSWKSAFDGVTYCKLIPNPFKK